MRRLDRIAGAFAVLLLVALGGWALYDHLHVGEPPRFAPAEFVAVSTAADAAASDARWLLIVNPTCAHCRETLAALAARLDSLRATGAHAAAAPPLAVLLVDTARRPADVPALARLAPGGVWWDSAQVWRRRWQRGGYGELLDFGSDGSLRARHAAGWLPHAAPQ